MLRFGAIYGPGKSSNHGVTRIFSEAIEAAAAGRSIPIGGGDQREDFVYSRDIPRAMLCALALLRDKPRRALPLVCNIGSGQGVSIAEFAEEVRRATGATLEVRAGTGVMGRDCRQSFVMDDSRARTILGYRPAYDLAGGIADYVAMLRNTTTTTAPAGADN
jgi:nucleoside-diphosphate-sugar epimerase